MPTQMPRKGRARMVTASSIASNSPPNAPKARRQDGKAPSPGSTIRSARATSSGRGGGGGGGEGGGRMLRKRGRGWAGRWGGGGGGGPGGSGSTAARKARAT